MKFLDPEWLVLLGLLFPLLILHMRKPPIRPVGSLILWHHIKAGRSLVLKWQLPTLTIALLLQILALFLIIAALAKPTFNPLIDKQHSIYIIDLNQGSGSAAQHRIANRLDLLEQYLQEDPSSHLDRFSLLLAQREPEILAARWNSPRGVDSLVRDLKSQNVSPDWSRLASLLPGLIRDNEKTRIIIFSDENEIPKLANIQAEIYIQHSKLETTQGSVPNIVEFQANPLGPRATGQWQLTGKLTDTTQYKTVDVSFRPQGTQSFLSWIRIPLNNSGIFSGKIDLPGPGILKASVGNQEEEISSSYLVTQEPNRHIKVLLLGQDYPALSRALRAIPSVEITQPSELPESFADFDLTIVNNAVLSHHLGIATLWIGAARLEGEKQPFAFSPSSARIVDESHPLSKDINWPLLQIKTAFHFDNTPLKNVVLALGDEPIIVDQQRQYGRDLRLSFSLEDTNFSNLASFPIFLSNVIDLLHVQLAPASACLIGQPCPLPERFMRATTQFIAPDRAQLELTIPKILQSKGDFPTVDRATFIPTQTGLYQLHEGTNDFFIAVNADKIEKSTIQPNQPISSLAPESHSPLWSFLIVMAGALLVIEICLHFYKSTPSFLSLLSTPHRVFLLIIKSFSIRTLTLFLIFLATLRLSAPYLIPSETRILISESLSETLPLNKLAIIELSANPHLVRDKDEISPIRPSPKESQPTGSNVKQAIQLARAHILPDQNGHIILQADNETRENSLEEIPSLLRRSIKLDRLMRGDVNKTSLKIESIKASTVLHEGDQSTLYLVVYSSMDGKAQISLSADGLIILEREIDLQKGPNQIELPYTTPSKGRRRFDVNISSTFLPNKPTAQDTLFIDVAGPPSIAIITPESDRSAALALVEILKSKNIESKIIAPKLAPWTLKQWLDYDAIILLNLPAIDLDTRQQEMIEASVLQHGHGLIIAGGENAYGPGGYFGTPLERMSPLSAKVPTDAPQVAMIFVLDRSGSMTQSVGDGTRLDIAKSATKSAIELLDRESEVSIIAFDSEAHVILPLQKKDLDKAVRSMASLTPGGGTAIYPGLVEAEQQLAGNESKLKHIVVMTDGLTQPGDFAGSVGRLRAIGASVSGVAIGSNADPAAVQEIARLGGGSFHATNDFQALPGILARESMLLSTKPIRTYLTQPVWVDTSSPFLLNMPDNLPLLRGYVLTSLKPSANLHMQTTDETGATHPLLASWRYGNGRIIAAAMHGISGWSELWQQTPSFSLFWDQSIRSLISETPKPGLSLKLSRNLDEVQIRLELVQPDGRPLIAAPLEAKVTSLSNAQAPTRVMLVALTPQQDGVQIGSFFLDQAGDYLVEVTHADERVDSALWVTQSSLEQPPGHQKKRLDALAQLTGGQILTQKNDLNLQNTQSQIVFERQWKIWCLLALASLFLDLTLRYAPNLFSRVRRQTKA